MFENINAIHAEAMHKRGYEWVKLALIDYLQAKKDYDNSPCAAMRNFKNECQAAYKAACEVFEAIFDEEFLLTDMDREILGKRYKEVKRNDE